MFVNQHFFKKKIIKRNFRKFSFEICFGKLIFLINRGIRTFEKSLIFAFCLFPDFS